MALITQIIPPQNFELVGVQIGAILTDELGNQAILDNTFAAPTVWHERLTVFDKEELPAINISLYKGEYDRKSARSVHGAYTYVIDVCANSPTIGTNQGDKLAARSTQRILGKIRAILDNPAYRRLAFAASSSGIETTCVMSFKAPLEGNTADTLYTTGIPLLFQVLVPEDEPLGDGLICEDVETTVTLCLTDKGYMYSYFPNGQRLVSEDDDTLISEDAIILKTEES